MMSHRPQLRSLVLLVPALALLGGCNSRSNVAAVESFEAHDIDPMTFDRDPKPQPAFKSTSEAKGIKLTLSASPALRRDEFGVRLRVENTGEKPFDWDKEFVGGLEWHVAISDGTKFLEPQKIVVNLTKVVKRDIAHPNLMNDPNTTPLVLDRFDRLDLSKSMMREITLQTLVEANVYVHEDETVTRPHYSKFKLPKAAKVVRVHMTYLPDHGTLRGVEKRQKLLLPAKAETNVLEIVLK